MDVNVFMSNIKQIVDEHRNSRKNTIAAKLGKLEVAPFAGGEQPYKLWRQHFRTLTASCDDASEKMYPGTSDTTHRVKTLDLTVSGCHICATSASSEVTSSHSPDKESATAGILHKLLFPTGHTIFHTISSSMPDTNYTNSPTCKVLNNPLWVRKLPR